ncbi:MAG: PH domain-containing protein [Crocinitomicaceae bacterium]|nr:PH domain-containing protein [Crocinitomicaceae bacterium]
MEKPQVIEIATFNPSIKKYVLAYVALILLLTIAGIPLLLVWFLGLGQTISRRYYENLKCQLTVSHLEYKKGVLFKVEKTIPLENIQDLTFIENPILNYFGLKILKIETAGGGNKATGSADMKLIGINGSHDFKELVLRQREKMKAETKTADMEMLDVMKEIRNLLEEIKNK